MFSNFSFKWLWGVAGTLIAISAFTFAGLYGLAWASIMDKNPLHQNRSWGADYADGRSVTGTSAATALVHGKTGAESAVIRGHQTRIASTRMTVDGQSVITADADGNVQLTDIAKAEQHHSVSEISILDRLQELIWNRPVKSVAAWSLSILAPLLEFHFKDCPDCPEMVVVPAGSFMMGSPENEEGRESNEGPQHLVTIARPFAVGRYEVTLDQYADFVSETGYRREGRCYDYMRLFSDGSSRDSPSLMNKSNWRVVSFKQEGTHPVVCIDWNDAQAYAEWLSGKTGHQYRLLSEAEWEYAARAGTTTRYSFGDNEATLGDYVWFSGNSENKTHPAGAKKPNAWGLYDMHGNVWEWAQDCWNENYDGAPDDGLVWTAGNCGLRVLRGGAWSYSPQGLRSAYRNWYFPDFRDYDVGFRLARTLNP